MVLQQVSKEYKCHSETLMRYYMRIIELMQRFMKVMLEFVLRIENHAANELALIASRLKIPDRFIERTIKVERKVLSSIIDS